MLSWDAGISQCSAHLRASVGALEHHGSSLVLGLAAREDGFKEEADRSGSGSRELMTSDETPDDAR
jgi:hypothetical protein